ncbi:MAG: DUF3857 and transglutaminase domain-containing protein [Acidobacteriota bacterium]
MHLSVQSHLRRVLRLTCLFAIATAANAATPWKQPTAEELFMTAQPEVPGAPAVILDHEETTDDTLQIWTFYSRIKILTAAGRDQYSTVTVKYPVPPKYQPTGGWSDNDPGFFTVRDITARTIRPDGTAIPFAGKAYDQTVVKNQSGSIRQKVFSLPSVEVGSIIEYRYTLSYEGFIFLPDWTVQSKLFARRQHFFWHSALGRTSWTSTVPGGKDTVKVVEEPASRIHDYTLDTTNTPPTPDLAYMPPIQSLEQRVVFYSFDDPRIYSGEAFWTVKGSQWSHDTNAFIGSSSAITEASAQLTAGAATDIDKLRRLYAGVMAMDNTTFTRAHSQQEDKAAGLSKTKTAADILEHKRGSADQLTMLFTALARAAGFKAYVMTVVNRDHNVFNDHLLSFSQFDDDIAIVELDGPNGKTDQFFDPGQRFCPFGQLQWMHTAVAGIRQTEKDSAIAETPMGSYKDSQTTRVADLTLDTSGQATGPITLTFTGAPALALRQSTLATDELAFHKRLEDGLRDILPIGAEVTTQSIDNLTDETKPLIAHLSLTVPLATVTSKRAILPAELFAARQPPLFPSPTRDIPVYFHYPERIADVVRIHFPSTWTVPTPPAPADFKFADMALYKSSTQSSPGVVILRRDYVLAAVVSFAREYTDLRTFYNKVAEQDQQPLVLSRAP